MCRKMKEMVTFKYKNVIGFYFYSTVREDQE